MLKPQQINRIVREAARAKLGRKTVVDVFSEPTVDSVGEEALRVTIVIAPGAATRVPGSAAVDALVLINDRLLEAGEERLPIIWYATEEELQEAGDDP